MKTLHTLFFCLSALALSGQQVADTAFQFPIARPRFASGTGSVVHIDAAHHNFHTADGRYAPFARLLRADGYKVASNELPFSAASLERCRILVISNAIDSTESWELPAHPAFSPAEINALTAWIKQGGRLLLIADHMPFAGCASELARSFGFEFQNCYALDNRRRPVERFYRSNGSLIDSELTRGIDTVVSFTGSAMTIPKAATGILRLRHYSLLLPQIAGHFDETTQIVDGNDYFQGAYRTYGQGRIVVMGEAAMFSAQLAGPNRATVGMNHPAARQNGALLLNILHWLDGN